MIDFAEKLACVLMSLGILLNAYVARRVGGSWIIPGALYSLFWFLVTFIPLVALPAVPANPLAILYIVASCVVFSAGLGIRRWNVAWRINQAGLQSSAGLFETQFLKTALYVTAFASVGSLVVDATIQGFGLRDFTTNLFESAGTFIDRRYQGDIVQNLFASAGYMLSYVAAAIGGLVLVGGRSTRERAFMIACALVPSVFVMLVQGAKGMLFQSIAFLLSAVLVRRIHAGNRDLMGRRTIIQGVAAIAVLFPVVTASFLARGLYDSVNLSTTLDGLMRYYASYSSGHLYAFSDWFSSYVGVNSGQTYIPEENTWGFYTFMAAFQLFGDDRYVPPGIYAEYFQHGFYLQTNIYTQYRGLITDFGIFPSLMVMALAGAASHEIFYHIVTRGRPILSAAAFIILGGAIYSSFAVSLFLYNGPYILFGILIIIIWANSIVYDQRRVSLTPVPTRVLR